MKTLSVLFAVVWGAISLRAGPTTTLDVAWELANGKYVGWTYGPNESSHQVDCVQFVLAVIEKQIGRALTPEARKAVLINYGWGEDETQKIAQAGTDPKLGGACYALTDISHIGIAVPLDNAQPGDIVQYWMYSKGTGKWFGHSGVIAEITKDRAATLLGAHASLGRVGLSLKLLRLVKDEDRRIYVVRLPTESLPPSNAHTTISIQ